ncbi:MAG: hypothetical protein E6324_02910 [Finegoldia magna]|uniref:hypothetical protein n=1 Tax=Finegoldia magna TaxID=1260 RepID=UPI00290EBCD4|nr:hypothetical protein [Finegoldia magna]MDU7032653.1 hypothetical protein [Finegoldia magna]
MKKKFTLVLLSLLMVIALSACSQTKEKVSLLNDFRKTTEWKNQSYEFKNETSKLKEIKVTATQDKKTGVAMATVTSDIAQLAGQGNNLGELHFAIQDGKAYLNYDAFANNLPGKMKEALIKKNLYFNVTEILQKLTQQNFQATTVRDFTIFMPLLSSNTQFQIKIAKDFVIDNKELKVTDDGNHKYSVNLTGEQWAKVMEYSRKTLLKNFKEYAKLAKGSELTDQEQQKLQEIENNLKSEQSQKEFEDKINTLKTTNKEDMFNLSFEFKDKSYDVNLKSTPKSKDAEKMNISLNSKEDTSINNPKVQVDNGPFEFMQQFLNIK